MKSVSRHGAYGFSLLEVMIAVVVLAFGLISLAALQGRLFQAGAESKARATASALAQDVLEDARAFPFAKAPTGYTGPTYEAVASWATPKTVNSGGVTYTISRGVTRYRPDGSVAAGAFDPAQPEFKVVDATVKWTGPDGTEKSVQMKDSLASLAPADAYNVIKKSEATERGPEVRIEPPNKDNPAVVPIAVGDDQSAASSNPIPRRFTKQDSNTAATIFSVYTYSSAPNTDPSVEVVLNRKLDVAGVTCSCSGVSKSTALNPAYEPVIWNGRQMAYMDPRPLPKDTTIGTYSGGQSTAEIDEMCTVCCRDHHESTSRLQRPDPYRALPNPLYPNEAYDREHYSVAPKSGSEPNVPAFTGPLSSGEYSEACQIIRVNGRQRLSIDPMQNMLVTVPMSDDGKSQEVRNDLGVVQSAGTFAKLYSELVVKFVESGAAAVKTMAGYLSPTKRFPEFNEADYSPSYDSILKPAPVILTPVTKPTKSLVSFGLYVDYLSPETLKAYDCALNAKFNTDDKTCDGLRNRYPLATLPFYVINVANVSVWKADAAMFSSPNNDPMVAVSSPDFDNKGILDGTGGVVTLLTPNKPAPCTKVSLEMTRSSSGIAGRLPIDPDDNTAANRSKDSMWFTANPAILVNSGCGAL